MTGADLIVLAPWLAFGAGLAVIGGRLLVHRRTSRKSAADGGRRGPAAAGGEDRLAARPPAPAPGRARGRGPASPRPDQAELPAGRGR